MTPMIKPARPSRPMMAARNALLARRAVLSRLRTANGKDGQALRSDERDSEEQASTEDIANVLVRLSERESREVREINAALNRIDEGSWGRCEQCGGKIAAPRLAAMPEARLCLACAT